LARLGFSVVGLAYHASMLLLSSIIFLTLAGSAFSALRKSKVICIFIQNSADVLKNVPRPIAVSGNSSRSIASLRSKR
jgi:hypothetical protein